MEASEQDIGDDQSDPVRLVGHPGKREPRGRRRLHRRASSRTYVEIKVDDIVDPPSKGGDLAPGEIAIWVRPDAKVLLFELDVKDCPRAGRPSWPRR